MLLKKHEIIYNLIWAFFKLNTILYIIYIGIGKPRYIKYDFSEERKQIDGVKYFYIGYYYLDFNRKVFGEVLTILRIKKFYRIRRINSLGVFPLLYY
jgi:hypothetical protein